MKILYTAIDQTVPGTTGGSIHVAAVASGLAALGHEVHVLTGGGRGSRPAGPHWHDVRPPLGARHLRMLRAPVIAQIARDLRPDVIIERYHNFGGESMRAAREARALLVLEVNAPVIDHTGSVKAAVDRLLVVRPMRRWRDRQCRAADLLVTPARAILPAWVAPERVLEIEWGADTDRFRPGTPPAPALRRGPADTIAVFAGAFRRWHGAIHLVDAIEILRARGNGRVRALLIGDGPERAAVQAAATGVAGVVLTGAVPHDDMPAWLAGADIGVAPFDVAAHPALAIEFYWSPLKIFEYMAAGLPVVAPDIPRLRRLIEHGREGLLYDPSEADGLANALDRLRDPVVRQAMGIAARERAVAQYSWAAHCQRLSEAFLTLQSRRCAS